MRRRSRRQDYYDLPRPTVANPRPHLLDCVLAFVGEAQSLAGVHRIALIGSLTTPKPVPKDADVLVTIDRDLDLGPLARLGRRLKGAAQYINLGADIFLADRDDQYIGRICGYRECFPRRMCEAQHCGEREHLNDDFHLVALHSTAIAAPPIDLWPCVVRRCRVPIDTERLLLEKLESQVAQQSAPAEAAGDTGPTDRSRVALSMPKLRVHAFAISIDGYGAGPGQSIDHPMGMGGIRLHEWALATRTLRRMFGQEGGSTGVDDDFAARGFDNVGAWIMGRNMFGPSRGPWPDDGWKGWWGEEPPYHCPVFVHTHHPREPIAMAGGTIFHFVTDDIRAVLKRAIEAAKGRDVRLGGGVATIRAYLQAGLVDEMHLAISPILLGSGEHLLAGLDLTRLGYRCSQHVSTPDAMHVVLTRRDA